MSTGNSSSTLDDMEEREALLPPLLIFVESLAFLDIEDLEEEEEAEEDEFCALRRDLAGACKPSNCKAALAMCKKMSM